MKNFDEDRIAEFEDFRLLVTEVAALNAGSGFLARAEKCISLARRLQMDNLGNGRRGFVNWIRWNIAEAAFKKSTAQSDTTEVKKCKRSMP